MYLTNLFTVGCTYQKKPRCYESKIHTKPVQITCTYDEIFWIWTIVFPTQHAQFTLGEMTWPQYILESHLMKSWYEKRYPAKLGLELDLPTNQPKFYTWTPRPGNLLNSDLATILCGLTVLMPVEEPGRHQAGGAFEWCLRTQML